MTGIMHVEQYITTQHDDLSTVASHVLMNCSALAAIVSSAVPCQLGTICCSVRNKCCRQQNKVAAAVSGVK